MKLSRKRRGGMLPRMGAAALTLAFLYLCLGSALAAPDQSDAQTGEETVSTVGPAGEPDSPGGEGTLLPAEDLPEDGGSPDSVQDSPEEGEGSVPGEDTPEDGLPAEEPDPQTPEDPEEEGVGAPEVAPADGDSSAEAPGETEEPEEPEEVEEAPASKPVRPTQAIQSAASYVEETPWARVLFNVALILLLTCLAVWGSKKLWLKSLRKNNQYLIPKFVYYFLQICICVVGILSAVGQIPMLSQVVQTLLAGSGILALALSLSAQESLNNLISGVFITVFKPFEIGDRVNLVSSDIVGTIEDITLRHTIIRTFTNTRLVIPNSTINKEVLENYNIMDARGAAFLDVTVAYECDLDRAMQIMAEVIGSHPQYLDVRSEEEKLTAPKVPVYVRELGASGISLRATMWTKTVAENYAACCETRLMIKRAFDAAGIEIPYTKYTILYQK